MKKLWLIISYFFVATSSANSEEYFLEGIHPVCLVDHLENFEMQSSSSVDEIISIDDLEACGLKNSKIIKTERGTRAEKQPNDGGGWGGFSGYLVYGEVPETNAFVVHSYSNGGGSGTYDDLYLLSQDTDSGENEIHAKLITSGGDRCESGIAGVELTNSERGPEVTVYRKMTPEKFIESYDLPGCMVCCTGTFIMKHELYGNFSKHRIGYELYVSDFLKDHSSLGELNRHQTDCFHSMIEEQAQKDGTLFLSEKNANIFKREFVKRCINGD
jgi:hypothetical protein